MMNLIIEPYPFTASDIPKIEDHYKAKFILSTEHNDIPVTIFYADKPHPESKSRYFGLYYTHPVVDSRRLMITNGTFIEDQEITGVIADNEDVIYSRYRHDYVRSPDGSVFIDGGRSYVRSCLLPDERFVTITVKDGEIKIDKAKT